MERNGWYNEMSKVLLYVAVICIVNCMVCDNIRHFNIKSVDNFISITMLSVRPNQEFTSDD